MNFAIYGLGNIARVHAEAILSIEGANLCGCFDMIEASREMFSKKYNIKAYSTKEELFSDSCVDTVCICTPNGTHADIAIEILSAGKNVVIEKPMATTVQDCDRIIEAEKKSSGRVLVISQFRMSDCVEKIKRIIQEKTIGKIVLCDLYMKYHRDEEYYKGSWKGTRALDGGGALMNQGVHGIDIFQYVCGPIKNIKSFVRTLVHDIEVEDTAVAVLEFESGAIGVVEATTSINPGFDREIKIYGSRGCVHLTENKITKYIVDDVEMPTESFISRNDSNNPTAVTKEEHAKQISAFMRVVAGEKIDYVNSEEGRKSVEIIQRIYENGI